MLDRMLNGFREIFTKDISFAQLELLMNNGSATYRLASLCSICSRFRRKKEREREREISGIWLDLFPFSPLSHSCVLLLSLENAENVKTLANVDLIVARLETCTHAHSHIHPTRRYFIFQINGALFTVCFIQFICHMVGSGVYVPCSL